MLSEFAGGSTCEKQGVGDLAPGGSRQEMQMDSASFYLFAVRRRFDKTEHETRASH